MINKNKENLFHKPLCFCFNVTKSDINTFLQDSSKSIDDLISEKKVGTKCTACLMDLDLYLDQMYKNKKNNVIKSSEIKDGKKKKFLSFKSFSDSGFCFSGREIETNLSLQNYDQNFSKKNKSVSFSWQLRVFNSIGNKVIKKTGIIESNTGTLLNISKYLQDEDGGWFIIKLKGQEDGFFGTLRPQVILLGPSWTASYHTQPHYMASKTGHRTRVFVKSVDSKLNAKVHVINASLMRNEINLNLYDISGKKLQSSSEKIPGRSGKFFDLDKVFKISTNYHIYTVEVKSSKPTRKHIINSLKDGSFSVDHFPN